MSGLTLIVPIDHRVELLPYHIAYYSRLGIRQFVYALWNGQRNPVAQEIRAIWDQHPQPGCYTIGKTLSCSYDEYNGPAETPGLNALRKQFVSPDGWYCIADLDEFYYFGGRIIPQVIADLEAAGCVAAEGVFHDRLARDGQFPPIPKFIPNQKRLDQAFPIAMDLTRQSGANFHKIAIARGDQEILSGHHTTHAKQVKNGVEVHHFKWHHGVVELLPRRFKAYSSQKLSWAGESQWFINLFKNPTWYRHGCLRAREATPLGI